MKLILQYLSKLARQVKETTVWIRHMVLRLLLFMGLWFFSMLAIVTGLCCLYAYCRLPWYGALSFAVLFAVVLAIDCWEHASESIGDSL